MCQRNEQIIPIEMLADLVAYPPGCCCDLNELKKMFNNNKI